MAKTTEKATLSAASQVTAVKVAEGEGLTEFFKRKDAFAVRGNGSPLHGDVILVELDLLDENPYQARRAMDEEKLEQLGESIAEHGLLEAIVVRRAGARFQIIAGHRRTAAVRRLFQNAQTEAERQRYARIPAQEKTDVDELKMEEFGLVENIHREDLSPLDLAEGVASFQRRTNLPTAQIAERLKDSHERIKRLLRLHEAPPVIKDGVSKGVMVPVLDPAGRPIITPSGREKQEHRTLDFVAADELGRLYQQWLKDGPKKATARIEGVIQKALAESWSLRRVQRFCKESMEGKAPRLNPPAAAPSPAFVVDEKRLVVHLTRIDSAEGMEKAALREVLGKLVERVSQ